VCAPLKLGRLGMLQWAREHDCPWDWRTCEAAAQGGQLYALEWAREHGCPWDWFTCPRAAQGIEESESEGDGAVRVTVTAKINVPTTKI